MLVTQPAASLGQLFSRREYLINREILSGSELELTWNGRQALLYACHSLANTGKGTKVLIPAYHCPACVTPVLQAGLQPVYYRITRYMTIDWDDLLAKINTEVAAVIIIHFFGIETDFSALDDQRHNGLVVIEDWSHSFLRGNPLRLAGRDTDFRIYSFWKTLPLQVGGALARSPSWRNTSTIIKPIKPSFGTEVRLAKRLLEEAIQDSDFPWAKTFFSAIESLRLRLKGIPRLTQANGGHAGNSGALVPRGNVYSMPRIATWAMRRIDLTEVLRIRQKHYNFYAHLFRDTPGILLPFPELDDSACPWLFPLIIADRESFSAYCRQRARLVPQTFGTTLHASLYHDLDTRMTEDANYLANHVVCLPIHQDLTDKEIESTGHKLLDYFIREAGRSL